MTLKCTHQPAVPGLRDLREFEKALAGRRSKWGNLGQHFDRRQPIVVARAPGRLDCMGGIADYSGSLVCELPLAEAALVAVQKREDDRLIVHSANAASEGLAATVELSSAELRKRKRFKPYDALQRQLATDPSAAWAAYLVGAFPVLQTEGATAGFAGGANIAVASDVPLGAGVSSSAAIEVAAMRAVCGAYDIELEGLELARLCQLVENRLVGAPCGIMDQMTSALGANDSLLVILCQPHRVLANLQIPPGWKFFGINSKVKHAVGGSKYTDTRTAAFMGHKIVAAQMQRARVTPAEYVPLGDYLCNLSPREFGALYRDLLPTKMTGAEFLKRYGDTVDPITSPDPAKTYQVRTRTEHPIFENARVQQFIQDLGISYRTLSTVSAKDAGELMYGSHWSYGNRCGMGSPETDVIVKLVKERGGNLLGAKITGGGSGGTVAVLGLGNCEKDVEWVAKQYLKKTGVTPDVFVGSSPGAVQFGVAKYRLT